MHILVINSGSSSIKYQLLDNEGNASIKGKFTRIGEQNSEHPTHASALAALLELCENKTIDAIGHRVVHGGEQFDDAAIIDDTVIEQIERCCVDAPLHNPYNLEGIQQARTRWPELPQVAVFDTAFHASLPRRARHYAIDPELAARHRIRRFGFHGSSHEFVAQQAAEALHSSIEELRLITLHLGNGASACAIEYGHSVETSMGMTPVEGLVMGTRSGDIDAGALLTLLRNGEYNAEQLDELLNRESGLLGLSGTSNDLREIEDLAEQGNDRAQLAINVFAHRARKYIGAYAAAMGGLDAIVFTGGIGENSATMRRRIMQRFEFLGMRIDEQQNQQQASAESPLIISGRGSRVHALVVRTDEEKMIARQTRRLIRESQREQLARTIPVAVSARHLHLTEATFQKLFGENSKPTHYKDISQPGQYACAEKVNLIGPRNRIDGVRLLGPLRSVDQIEIARTDEFKLGVDAPIRDSGKIEGSAPIILEGPAGQVELTEGLICARRHIHMHPDDAAHFDVADKDIVEVAITGGPRDLSFGDVLVRVSEKYKLEMHIDTDEGNAAELSAGAEGSLVHDDCGASAAILKKTRG